MGPRQAPAPSTEALRRLPKPELHVHLDGSLRPTTMVELAADRGVTLPAPDAEGLADAMLVRRAMSLEQYLEGFAVTLSLMQDAEALDRIACELVEDCAADGVTHLEVRFCPALCTEKSLTSSDVLDAVLAGLARGSSVHSVESRVIVCALRSLPPSASQEMVELALAYQDRGVCAFDLAGSEAGHPVHDHAAALDIAARGRLPVTIHAGEAYGPASIREAIEIGHARRIGHGTRLQEDADLVRTVRDAGVALEVCLTSNVQTGVTPSYRAHPLRRYFDEGIRVCLCTDNRLMSGVTLTREYEHARDALGFSWSELASVARMGFECAFVPDGARAARLADLEAVLTRQR
ncbi:MAG: adenosine deaminase [Gemmatimonadota bacterium]